MGTDKVVGMGEVLWDVFPDGKKMGGAPANFAYHMSRFGFESYVVSAVGNDDLGREILNVFEQKGLSADRVETVDYPTGTVYVQLDDAGIPAYDITRNVAWDYIPYTSALHALAGRVQAVCFGSLAQRSEVSRTTVLRFLDAMPAESYKIFDINLRGDFYTPEIIESGFERCNILKINDEELVWVTGAFGLPADEKEACTVLLQRYGLRGVVLTCGAVGSYVFTPDETSFLDTPRVEVEDTVGAGDSFTASFCAAMLKGRTIPEAHRLAVDVSAFVCSRQGAMPELPVHLKNRLLL